MKGEAIWTKLLLFALFSSLVFGNPISKQNGTSEDVQVATVNGTEVCIVDGESYQPDEELPTKDPCEFCTCRPPGLACEVIKCEYIAACRSQERSGLCCPQYVCEEVSKGGESEPSEVSVVEDETTESSVQKDGQQSNSARVLDTNSTMNLFPENITQDENETVTEIIVIETEKYSEEVQIPDQTTFQPTILEDTLKSTGENLTVDRILKNATEVDEISYLNVTPAISEYADGDEIKTPEVIEDANVDALDVQQTTTFPHQIEEEQIKGDTQVHSNDASLHTEEDLRVVTEIPTRDVTPVIEETTTLILQEKEADEEKLRTTLMLKEESQLTLLLKERVGQIQKKTSASSSADQGTSERVESIDSNNQTKDQTELTTALGEHLKEKVEGEAQNEDQSQRDTETTTQTSFEDALIEEDPEITTVNTIEEAPQRDFETTTQNISENGEEEMGIDVPTVRSVEKKAVDPIGQGNESEQTAKILLDEKGKTAELVKENSEPQVINKIYRSEIEELRNKLITRVKLEGSSSNIKENVETIKADATTETYESTTLLNLPEQYENTETTESPDLDSLSRGNSTTEASESQTERIESPSSQERNKNKGSDYWLEMMGNRDNRGRNKTRSHDGKVSEDEETNLEREDSVTYTPTMVEDTTRVFIIGDENETSHPMEFDLLVTTETVSEARQATEMTEISVTESPQRNNDSDKEEKDKLTEELVTLEPLTEEIVMQEVEITTAAPSDVEFDADDEHEETTQVTLLTVADLEKNEEDSTANLPSKQVIEKVVHSQKVLNPNPKEEDSEDTPVGNETRTESPISGTMEAQSEQESEPDETRRNTNTTENGSQTLEETSSTKLGRTSNKGEEEGENETSPVEAASTIHTKPQRIEQHLSHLAEKFGKLGLRPVLRRRAKHGPKRKRVDRYRYRKQLLKNF